MEKKQEEMNKGSAIGAVIGQVVLGAVCLAAGWICCGLYGSMAGKEDGKPRAVGPAEVTVATTNVEMRAYNLPEKFVAHAEPLQEVELLPQVDGYIKEILFKEGDVVKAGQTLYILDDERYQAVVNQRKADLEAAQAEERRAARYYKRMLAADARGITQLERDNAEAAAEKADAAVLQAKANLVVAEYNCKKAKIFAPISGQIGKTSAHVGDYVAPSKGALAHIVQTDPIRVSFPMTDRAFLAWRKSVKDGRADENRLRVLLPDGTEYGCEGAWDFDDNEMSKTTASIILRLRFANPDRLLVPGAYLTLLADLKNPPTYPSVPQTAIVDLPGGNLGVYILKEGNVVEVVPVETLPMHEGFVPVVKGLAVGQKVVVSGTRKLQNGMKVAFAEATPNEENTPGWKGKQM